MLRFLNFLLTWWNGQTIGTWLFTVQRGREVGRDDQGNRYFEEKAARKGRKKRRWVIYDGLVEASRVPPDWHTWLHFLVDTPPDGSAPRRAWQKPHRPNYTGTAEAYRPAGSLAREAVRAKGTGDYEAWVPPAEGSGRA